MSNESALRERSRETMVTAASGDEKNLSGSLQNNAEADCSPSATCLTIYSEALRAPLIIR